MSLGMDFVLKIDGRIRLIKIYILIIKIKTSNRLNKTEPESSKID